MEIHGKFNLVDSEVKSDEFASNKQFNKLLVNNLSEVDQGTLDHDVIIFNKEDDQVYTYDVGHDSWKSLNQLQNDMLYDNNYLNVIYIDDEQDVYNQFEFIYSYGTHGYLVVDKEMFNFGAIGSPIDFVIDFWLKPHWSDDYNVSGTILHNGLDSGSVDTEVNKNLTITTTGIKLLRASNYQDDPHVLQNADADGHLYINRPELKSYSKLITSPGYMTHVALIRSGDTTYLAINGRIEDSAPSVEYFHYDDVKIGDGFIRALGMKIINLRVTKNDDLGWTSDFVPPNHNITPDGNTDFLMDSTSIVDTIGNHAISTVGIAPIITQDRFYYQLTKEHIGSIIKTNLEHDDISFRLPLTYISDEYSHYDHMVYFDADIFVLSNYHYENSPTFTVNELTDLRLRESLVIHNYNQVTKHEPRTLSNFFNDNIIADANYTAVGGSIPYTAHYHIGDTIRSKNGNSSAGIVNLPIIKMSSMTDVEYVIDMINVSNTSYGQRLCNNDAWVVDFNMMVNTSSGTLYDMIGFGGNQYHTWKLINNELWFRNQYHNEHIFTLELDHWYHFITYKVNNSTIRFYVRDISVHNSEYVDVKSWNDSSHSYDYIAMEYHRSPCYISNLRMAYRNEGNFSTSVLETFGYTNDISQRAQFNQLYNK